MTESCCFLIDDETPCPSPATWRIDVSGRPYSDTYSCDAHLHLMLEDGVVNEVMAYGEGKR